MAWPWLVVSHLAVAVATAAFTYLLPQARRSGPSGERMQKIDTKKVWRRAEVPVYGFAILSLLIAAVTAVVSVLDSREQQRCFNEYANELALSLEPRQAASEERTAAQVDWQNAVGDVLAAAETVFASRGTDTSGLSEALAEFRAADEALAEAEEQLQQERRQNPYPQAPREVC